jgi:hypothetical protein
MFFLPLVDPLHICEDRISLFYWTTLLAKDFIKNLIRIKDTRAFSWKISLGLLPGIWVLTTSFLWTETTFSQQSLLLPSGTSCHPYASWDFISFHLPVTTRLLHRTTPKQHTAYTHKYSPSVPIAAEFGAHSKDVHTLALSDEIIHFSSVHILWETM